MRPKSLALLMLALGCGLVASIGITEFIARRNAENVQTSGATQTIFVATTDVGMGDFVTPQVLKPEQWQKDKVPAGAISKIADIEGRRARTRLYAGEPILEKKLLGKGASEQGASALIPKNYRMVTVKVDLVSGGSSLILPGDRVDVMVHLVRDLGRDIPETVTRTILQDIKVFAVNDVLGVDGEKDGGKSIVAKTISLLVTPEQAAKVTLASQLGSIQLVMRSPEDDQQAPIAQAKPSELFGTPAAVKGNRGKETLMEPASLNDQAKGILDLLGSMKKDKKVAETVKKSAAVEPPAVWTMRVLKPGTVDSVQFARETAGDDATGAWKSNGAAAGGAPADKKASPNVTPPAVEPPVEPAPQAGIKKSGE